MLSQGEPRDAAVNFNAINGIKFYNGIVRFFFHSTAFLYTLAAIQMLKLHRIHRFSRLLRKITAIAKNHDQNNCKSHVDREYVLYYSATKCYNVHAYVH